MTTFVKFISLNAFIIIINYGVNVNIKNDYNAAAHILFYSRCNVHINSILDLLIKHGLDLNIINYRDETLLDVIITTATGNVFVRKNSFGYANRE